MRMLVSNFLTTLVYLQQTARGFVQEWIAGREFIVAISPKFSDIINYLYQNKLFYKVFVGFQDFRYSSNASLSLLFKLKM